VKVSDVTLVFLLAALIIVIGAASNYLFTKTGIPDMLFLVILGIVVGPVLGILKSSQIQPLAPFLAVLAVVIMLFDGGLGLSIPKMFSQAPRAIILAVLGFVLSVTSVMVYARYFLGMRLLEGALLGSIVGGSSSIVVIAIARRLGLSEKSSTTLILESSVTDVLCLVGGLTVIGVLSTGLPPLAGLAREISSQFTTGIVLGAVVGLIWLSLLPKISDEPYRYMVTLGAILLTYFSSEFLGGSGAISALMFGIVLANSSGILRLVRRAGVNVIDESFRRLESEMVFLIKAFFFVYLGLIVNLADISLIILGIILSVVLLFVRFVAVVVSTARSELQKEKGAMTITYGRGLAAAILSVLPIQYALPRAEFYPPVALIVIVITVSITSLGAAMGRKPPNMAAQNPVSTGRGFFPDMSA
jgi:cell volume regulation protein A